MLADVFTEVLTDVHTHVCKDICTDVRTRNLLVVLDGSFVIKMAIVFSSGVASGEDASS